MEFSRWCSTTGLGCKMRRAPAGAMEWVACFPPPLPGLALLFAGTGGLHLRLISDCPFGTCATGSSATSLHLPKRHDQEIHRENPDEDHLPEPQIASAVVIAGNFRVAVEKAFSDTQNVKTGEENDHQADAEDDSQRDNGISMLVNDG